MSSFVEIPLTVIKYQSEHEIALQMIKGQLANTDAEVIGILLQCSSPIRERTGFETNVAAF